MQGFLFSPVQLSELELIVENSVKRALLANPPREANSTDIINRAELCKRLNITEPTCIRWQRKGKIPYLRIGSAIRYDWQNVLKSLGQKKGSQN